MKKKKLNLLYDQSKEIANLMYELGIKEYKNKYILKNSILGLYLMLDDTFITNSFVSTYIDENLSLFVPATTLEVVVEFEKDLKNHFFEELFEKYNEYKKAEPNQSFD